MSYLLRILLPDAPLHRIPLRDPVNPLQQVRKRSHLLVCEAGPLPPLDPRPSADVADAIFALAVAGEVVARATCVFPGEMDLDHAEDAEDFVAEAGDGVYEKVRIFMAR